MNPKVSIILPTYNGSKYIKRAIESVLSQTLQDWELLIIDDGSVDNTRGVIEEYTKKDKRIIYLYQENQGPGIARNYGIDSSVGEYIAFIDDDDAWTHIDKIKRQVDFLEKNLDYVLVGTNGLNINEKGERITELIYPQKDEDIRRIILQKNCFINSSVLINKISLKGLKGNYFRNKRYAEDYHLWLFIGNVGKFGNLKEIMVNYVTRSGNITSKNKIKQIISVIKSINEFKDDYPHYLKALIVNSLRLIVFWVLIKLRIFNFLVRVKNYLFK